MDAIRLIRYTHAARRRYLKTLGELPWDEVVKDRGASFSSIRDIFLHSLDMEDMVINYVIPGKYEEFSPPILRKDYGKFIDVGSVEKRVNEVEEKVDAYLSSLTQRELDMKRKLPWRKDLPIILRIEDILVFVAIENISHMGELIAVLWQMDKQPPFLSWANFLHQGA